MDNPLYALFEKDGVSKTDRGGTQKRLLLHTTPCLKESGKAHRKSPSAITEPKTYPRPTQLPSALGPVLEKPPPFPRRPD